MQSKEEYIRENATLGSAIAIINKILQEETDELKNMGLTFDEAIKKQRSGFKLQLLLERYLGRDPLLRMDSWRIVWCDLQFEIHKERIYKDEYGKSMRTTSKITYKGDEAISYNDKLSKDILTEYKEKYKVLFSR